MNPDDHDYEAARQAASELWRKEQIHERLTRLHADRPPAFAVEGELHPDVADWADRIAVGERGGLVLTGNVGAGKTWSLWKAAERLVQAGYRGRIEIVAAHQLRRLIAPPIDETALDRLAAADWLAIDDVGSVRVSEWDADHLMALVDTRWAYQRPTTITSNTTELRPLLGDRVASRLVDRARVVKMTGTDRRRSR